MKNQQTPTEPEVVEFYNEVVEIIDEHVNQAITLKKNLKIKNLIKAVARNINVEYTKLVNFLSLFNCKYTISGGNKRFVVGGVLTAGNSYHTIKKNALVKLSKLRNYELKNFYDIRCNIGRI